MTTDFKTKTGRTGSFVFLIICFFLVLGPACKDNSVDPPNPGVFQLLKVSADNITLSPDRQNSGISPDVTFKLFFTSAVDTSSAKNTILISQGETAIPSEIGFEDENRTVIVTPVDSLDYITEYQFQITDQLMSEDGAQFIGVQYDLETLNGTFQIESATVNGQNLSSSGVLRDILYNDVEFIFAFSEPLDPSSYQTYFNFSPSLLFSASLSQDGRVVTLTSDENLDYYRFYTSLISPNLKAVNGFEFDGFEGDFQTGLNPEDKFPRITDEELLTKVQEATFGYFWDFGHPVSGLARERNNSGDVVTTGGSGFGLMALIVGIERGFITRAEGIQRFQKIIGFLGNEAERFHGAWSHWLNGTTGQAIPFSSKDDGADLVETAFLAQGMIAVREYMDENVTEEAQLITDINTLLDGIEWNWFTRGGQNVLYWHWSPNYGWDMNMQIKGYNEALIIYILAASSTDYGIAPEVYTQGWASSGNIVNGNSYYGIELPVGYPFGGPLFFAHYSFLGLNPQGLSDTYANYWDQNVNHSLINQLHSIQNPGNYVGYSAESWGITASDEPNGYSAHDPVNDNGTLTPTAAISSIPYTPQESLDAIRHFYYKLGDKLWGEYGFYDAFNPTQSWWANSYLAIDQGPIVVMIENYRTGLIWDLFMQAPEVQQALSDLNFTIQP